MKKFLLAFSLLTLSSFGVVSCKDSEEVKVFVVTFDVDGIQTTVNVNQGDLLTKPEDPKKDGYNFIGWFTDKLLTEDSKFNFDNPINENITLYAGFEPIPKTYYTVTFELNGGSFVNGEKEVQIEEGMLVTRPSDPIKEGYTFINWYKDNNGQELFDFLTPINEDITIYAIYKENKVETRYDVVASSFKEGHRADYAVDEDTNSYWEANNNEEQTLTFDLGEVKTVNKVSQEFNDLSTWTFTISGSIDNQNYATLMENNNSVGTKFEKDIEGYYRYIKLTIAPGEKLATSKDFIISFNELKEGSNLSYGMKGVADCWSGGFESELMFDGDENTYHCCSSPHENHYMGFENVDGLNYYVKYIEIVFPDSVDHQFYLDYRDGLTGSWITPEGGDYTNNIENIKTVRIDINNYISAALLHYNSNSASKWPAISEFRVVGFKELNKDTTPNLVDNKNIYDLGSLCYIDRIKVSNISENTKVEISIDGTTYEEVNLENTENGYILIDKEARYLRVNSDTTLSIFGTKYERNLAVNLLPIATTHSSDSGFWENMMTMNKDCKEANTRYWCTSNFENTDTIELDLKNECLVDKIVYKYQDPLSEGQNSYKLKIEVSSDKENYVTLLDTTENGASGQEFIANNNNNLTRYIKITTQYAGGWTNCNTLAVYGYGSTK